MSNSVTVKFKVHLARGAETRLELREGAAPPQPLPAPGRVPRVSRLMALAIKFDTMIRSGEVRDQAEIARLGGVTRARVTQVLNLQRLAPEIQEALLFLPRVSEGCDPIGERDLRPIAACPDWGRQRRLWRTAIAPLFS